MYNENISWFKIVPSGVRIFVFLQLEDILPKFIQILFTIIQNLSK